MSALNELQAHGYMTMRRVRNEQTGQFVGWEKVIRETPIPQDEAIPTAVRKSPLGKKARNISTTAEVRKPNVGIAEVRKSDVGTEVRKSVLRENRQTEKPQNGKSDYIINTDRNKYLNQEVSISPLPPSGEMQVSGTQLELCFSGAEVNNTSPLASEPEPSKLSGRETIFSCGEKSSAPRFTIDSLAPESEQTLLSPVEIAVATDAVENVAAKDFSNAIAQNAQVETTAAVVIFPCSSQASDRRRESSRTPFDALTLAHDHRFTRSQSQYPKNIDGSDRLPWETQHRGKFNPDFEQHMARSLGNYPAYKDLLPGELIVKVRKHISAAKYDLKRRDQLEIEWSAMHSTPQLPDGVSSTEVGAAKTYAHFAHLFGVSS